MQVGDSTYSEARKVGDCDSFGSSHRNWQSADRRRLIDDEQHATMFFDFCDECSKLGFIVRQSTIEQALSSQIQRHGVISSFANVDANEDLNALLLFDIGHRYPLVIIFMGGQQLEQPVSASTLRASSE